MKRLIATILVGILLLGTLVGCGGGASNEADPDALTVYSGHPQELTNMYVKEFEEKTGIKADIVSAGGGELIKRIEAEQENPLADVLMGIGAESLDAKRELFQSYETENIDDLREGYMGENNTWTGDFIIPMVIMYNKDLVSEDDVPQTWTDLLDPKFKGKIAMGDPLKSGSSYTQLATMLTAFGKGEEAWDFVEDLIENMEYKVISSSGDVPKRISDGELAVGITIESHAYEYMLSGANTGIVYPTEGTSARSSAVGIVKDANNKENAELFLDFITSKESQQNVADTFYRRPVRIDVDLAEGLLPYEDINVLKYDFAWASDSKDEFLDKWKNLIVSQ